MKVSEGDYYTFKRRWNAKEFLASRYGQAFVNFAAVSCGVTINDLDLFYSRDINEAHRLVHTYVDWTGDHELSEEPIDYDNFNGEGD